MSINYFETNNPQTRQALWDCFWYRAVDQKRDIPIEDIERMLRDCEKSLGEWKELSPKAKRFGLNRGLGTRYRRKIKQLKHLLKVAKKGAKI